MARQRMVTRTIKTLEVTVLCLDTETAEPSNMTVAVSATIKGEKAMLNAVRKQVETDDFKVVKVVKTEEHEALYRMAEEDFIAHAEKIEQ